MRRVVDGPYAAPAGIGRIFPYVFGTYRGVMGIPLRTGAQAAFRETALSTTTTFLLDDAASLVRFPESGTGQVGGERFTWSARDFTAVALTGITRGTEDTLVGAYGMGEPIHEVVDEHVYGFFENPGTFAHTSLDAIYINGLLKPASVVPTHTLTVEDTAAVYDPVTGQALSVGTVRFDTRDAAGLNTGYSTPESVAALRAQQAYITASNAATMQRLQEQQRAGAGYAITTMPVSTGGLKLLPALGLVSADVTGLHDDATGMITGIPRQFLSNPAHIARIMLQEGFAQAPAIFDTASWTAAAARAAAYGYRWACQFFPMEMGAFQEAVFRQSRINVFQDSGLWRAVFRQRGTSAMTLTPARRVSWAMRWTPVQAVIAALNVSYAEGEQERTVIVTSAAGRALVPAQTAEMRLPWITEGAIARNLGDWHLALRDHPRRLGTALHHVEALALVRTDTIAVDTPMLAPYGGTDLLWKLQALRFRPDGLLELALEEEDPLEILLEGSITGMVIGVGLLEGTPLPAALAGVVLATATLDATLMSMIGAALAGEVTGSASLVGALILPIVLTGAAAGTATATGALTTGAPALQFAHGAIQWLAADAVNTVYTVSGLPFRPTALEFAWGGLGSSVNAVSATAHLIRGTGFATSPSDRRAVCGRSNDGPTVAECMTGYRNDCVAFAPIVTPALDGALDLNTITSDGFTLIVDDQISADLTVFYKAYGNTTVATIVDIAEPAATGIQDYTATGFVSSGVGQVVLIAGIQETGAANTISRNDSGYCYGFAAGATPANIVVAGNSDDGALTMVTGSYCQTGECLAMLAVGTGNPNARATLTQWNTNGFRLNWLARGVTNRRYIALAMKGGQWAAGSVVIAQGTLNATAAVSGLPFAPQVVIAVGIAQNAPAAGIKTGDDTVMLGVASSTTSRRGMGHRDANGQTVATIGSLIRYDALLGLPTSAGAVDLLLDLSTIASDGFTFIIDDAFGTTAWVGYLAGG